MNVGRVVVANESFSEKNEWMRKKRASKQRRRKKEVALFLCFFSTERTEIGPCASPEHFLHMCVIIGNYAHVQNLHMAAHGKCAKKRLGRR